MQNNLLQSIDYLMFRGVLEKQELLDFPPICEYKQSDKKSNSKN
jgi:hypothetical protein